METVHFQERELQLQGSHAWSFHTLDDTSSYSNYSASSGGGDCFLLGWEPPFGCFGVAAADPHLHDLFPLYMESLPESPAASTAAAVPPEPQDAVAMPEELDDLLLNFWDASSYGDVSEPRAVAINSSCVVEHELSSSTTTNSFLHDDPLGSIFSTGPNLPEILAPAEEKPLLSSSSSNCHADATTASGGDLAPPLPRCSSSLKRATPEADAETEECNQSGGGKRRKTAAPSARVLCPFAVLKPDGLDGGATLADINARILMRPSRPVRHPVGEFACAPRVSADKPGISGKAVSGFTRLHTPGRGTITIIRTRG